MYKPFFLALALLCLSVSSVGATTLQLSVSGHAATTYPPDTEGVGESFSVSILLDSESPDLDQQDEYRGVYAASLGLGVLLYGGVTYTEIGVANTVYVLNNVSFGDWADTFSYSGFFRSESGVVIDLDLQFVDTSNAVFSDDSRPDSLDVGLFDSFNVSDPFSGTVASLYFVDPAIESVFGPIEFAQLRPVPVPAAIWFFLSGIGLLFQVSRNAAN